MITEFEQAGIVEHAFTTKLGGVSKGDYAELNLGLHIPDITEDVVENRGLMAEILNSDSQELVAAKQVHGDQIKVITADDKGRGALDYASAIAETDALITDQPDILLTSYYADCTPIFLLDPVRKVVALAHAGWKGTVKKIAQKTALKMKEVYQSEIKDILVAIGPAIGQCCYQVDQRVIESLAENFTNWEELVVKESDTHWRFNMALANQRQLEEVGVKTSNIIHSNLCTSCNEDLFFSYRRDQGQTGRMASMIKLKGTI